jgi:DNA-binding XRE family transcriptional regulator
MGRDGKPRKIAPFGHGLTQIELAAASHLAPAAISFLETGQVNPKLTTMQQMASALNCSVRHLMWRGFE